MEPLAPTGRRWRKLIATATGAATMCVGAGVASAGGGGGIASPSPPELTGVICLERCAGERIAAEGSRVRLDGSDLEGVDEIRFAGSAGRISVEPSEVAPTAVEAKVPEGADTGTVQVSAYGERAATPRDEPLEIVDRGQIPEAGDFALTSAEATPRKTYFDGVRAPRLSYLFQGAEPTDVRVDVVDADTEAVVRTLIDRSAEPNSRNSITWDGRNGSGALAPNGAYSFEIANAAGGSSATTPDSDFGFFRYRFPIAAHHSYGDGFGAGRRHQGQDVFARCGAPLRAARGGRVSHNETHAAAGNYLVVDGKGTGLDFMYAHMQGRSPLREGARVKTGQLIGRVGESGNASGCHLHFEAWSAPGWYEGGQALPSVRRMLKTWDSWS